MLLKNYAQIEIPKRSQICAKGNEPLSPGMEYYSVLVEDDEKEMVRHDYCSSCWDKFVQKEVNKQATHWKSKVPTKKEETALPKQRDERAMILLKHGLTKDSVDAQAEAFVLALYLARKRIINLRQELAQEDGSLISLYEVADTEEMLIVKKLKLSQLQTEKIQQDLAKKFKPSATLED